MRPRTSSPPPLLPLLLLLLAALCIPSVPAQQLTAAPSVDSGPECYSAADCSVATDGGSTPGAGGCTQFTCENGTCKSSPRPVVYECRASAGVCDVPEFCDGVSLDCPRDEFQSSYVCRPSVGACDAEERCTGTSAACPPDALRPAGTTCRYTKGDCDVPEVCSGNNTACPPDALAPPGPRGRRKQCRAAVDACDAAELCAPDSPSCPSDYRKDKGYAYRCGSTCYTCAISTDEVKDGELDGCKLGGCSEVVELAWPACDGVCVPRYCPNGREVAFVAFANCNKGAGGTWSCSKQQEVKYPATQTFPICP